MLDNNDLFRGLAVQGLFYRIESKNGSLDLRIFRKTWHGDISSLLSVDLDRQSDGVIQKKRRVGCGPRRGRDQRRLAERGPALLGKMRHHRRNELDQDAGRLC